MFSNVWVVLLATRTFWCYWHLLGLTMHRSALTAKNYLAPKFKSAKVEKVHGLRVWTTHRNYCKVVEDYDHKQWKNVLREFSGRTFDQLKKNQQINVKMWSGNCEGLHLVKALQFLMMYGPWEKDLRPVSPGGSASPFVNSVDMRTCSWQTALGFKPTSSDS